MAEATLSICTVLWLSIPAELACSGACREIESTEATHEFIGSGQRVWAVARLIGMVSRHLFPVTSISHRYVYGSTGVQRVVIDAV